MNDEFYERHDLAMTYYLQQDYENALRILYEAIRTVDPMFDRDLEQMAMINIAEIYDEMNENEKALQIYSWIAKRYDAVEGLYGMAMIYEKRKEYDRALFYYHKAVEKDPGYQQAIFFLANLYDVMGKTDEAVYWYQKNISLAPDDFMAYNNLGAIYEGIGELDKALHCFDRSVALKDDYFRSHFNRGVVLKRLNRHDEAMAEYEKAERLNPSFSDVYLNMSALLIEQRAYQKSCDVLRRGTKSAEKKGNLYYNLACCQIHLGQEEEAKINLKKAFKEKPTLFDYFMVDQDVEAVRQDILGDHYVKQITRQDKKAAETK